MGYDLYRGQPKKNPINFEKFNLELCNFNSGWNDVIALELEENSNLQFYLEIKNIDSYLIENIVPKIKENMVSEYYEYYRNGKKIQNFYDPISFFKGVVLFNDKKIPFEFHETINQNKGEIIFFNDGEEIFFNNLIYKKIDDKDMSNDKEWDGFIEVLSDYGIVLSSQFYFSGSSMIRSGYINYNRINWKISSERSKNKNGYIFEIKAWCDVYYGRRNFIFKKQVLEDEINDEDIELKYCEKISLNYESEGYLNRSVYEYIDIITIENYYTNIEEVKKDKIPQKIVLCFEQTKKYRENDEDSNEIIKFEFYNYKEDLYININDSSQVIKHEEILNKFMNLTPLLEVWKNNIYNESTEIKVENYVVDIMEYYKKLKKQVHEYDIEVKSKIYHRGIKSENLSISEEKDISIIESSDERMNKIDGPKRLVREPLRHLNKLF